MPNDPIEPTPAFDPPTTETGDSEAAPPALPHVPLVGSTSGDEITAILTHPRPDPLLGEFKADGDRPRRKGDPGSSSADALKALRLSIDRTAGGGRRSARPSPAATLESDEPAGIRWPTVVLGSYASAVTLALIWVLWSGRRLPEPEATEEPAAAEAPADPGLRAGRSRRVGPVAPAVGEKTTTIGKPIRLGSIEVTPLRVGWATVVLERQLTRHSFQKGGDDCLRLVLRLRNVSGDSLFAPLDEAFLRGHAGGEPHSMIEIGEGGVTLPLYPLAVESEWRIVDQEVLELGPGELYETSVYSAPGAPRPLPGPITWRIRLRTGIGQTETVVIRVEPDEVIEQGRRD